MKRVLNTRLFNTVLFVLLNLQLLASTEDNSENLENPQLHFHYLDGTNESEDISKLITEARKNYKPPTSENCSCYTDQIEKDLLPFRKGIFRDSLDRTGESGEIYKIIDHKLYRWKKCFFPARCSGVEHFLVKLVKHLPDMEFVLNTKDWPQVSRFRKAMPVFSFSKNPNHYWDILYPTWSFWEGGPAISLYPTGLGRWDVMREKLVSAAKRWPWEDKLELAFFRGSRTSEERDSVVVLSRERPDLVDAKYTKNQAWKSDADTLFEPPAQEVNLENHCQYKYLFNYKGVAASFRFRHLLLCGSLVYHANDDWIEFFYPSLKPWMHYIPFPRKVNSDQLISLLQYAKTHDAGMKHIAEEGFKFAQHHLRMEDIFCYWEQLLKSYSGLMKYKVTMEEGYQLIS